METSNNNAKPTLDKQKLSLVVMDSDTSVTSLKQFSCGNDIIDKYAHKNLKSQAKAPGAGVTVILNEEKQLVGFVTISAHSLAKQKLTSVGDFVGATTMIPVVKLTMLGVDKRYQSQGIGGDLMAVAFERTHIIASAGGCAGLYLEADHYAIEFYKRLGFVALDNPDPITLVVPMFLHLNGIPK